MSIFSNQKKLETLTWPIRDLYNTYKSKNFTKPKFQRKMKWTSKPSKNKKKANFKEYIDFLMKYKNSQIPIALGKQYSQNDYAVCDGNNRIHAIIYFLESPYKLYNEWFCDIINHIKNEENFNEMKDELINMIKNLTYNEICNYTLHELTKKKLCPNIRKKYYNKIPMSIWDNFNEKFTELKEKFWFNYPEKFDAMESIKIVVNIFHNYTYVELSNNYREVHAKQQQMDEFDLLAASLGSITDFTINCKGLKDKLLNIIHKYYENRCREDELLRQYEINSNKEDYKWSAFDFLLAFQEYIHDEYKITQKLILKDNVKDISCMPYIFKLYNILHCNGESIEEKYINTRNINLFINQCKDAFSLLRTVINEMYPKKLEKKGSFSKIAREWKGTSITILISLCIKLNEYNNENDKYNDYKKNLKSIIYYHTFVDSITVPKGNKELNEQKDIFKQKDILSTAKQEIRTNPLDFCCRKILKGNNPFEELTPKQKDLNDLAYFINDKEIKKNTLSPIKNPSSKKRKKLSTFNYAIMINYWYNNMPFQYIKKIENEGLCLHNEHIIPFSTKTKDRIAIDRLGNFSPIMENWNLKRGNRHISEYYKNQEVYKMLNYLKVFPSEDKYDSIIKYIKSGANNVPHLRNKKEYDDFCKANENIYISSFIQGLYS